MVSPLPGFQDKWSENSAPRPTPPALGVMASPFVRPLGPKSCPATVPQPAARLSQNSFRVHWCLPAPSFHLSQQQVYSRCRDTVKWRDLQSKSLKCLWSTYTINHTWYSMLNCFFSHSSYLFKNISSLYKGQNSIFNTQLLLRPQLVPQSKQKLIQQLITLDIRYSTVSSISNRTANRTQTPSTIDHTRYSMFTAYPLLVRTSNRTQTPPTWITLDIRWSTVSSVSARTSQRSLF